MVGLTIATSGRGTLWPSEYWKTLIDSLCRRGAKKDPRLAYPNLSSQLSALVREVNGRFVPSNTCLLAAHDDTAISLLKVIRVESGFEALRIHDPELPDTAPWLPFEFPYFGTIGDTKAEQQAKENRQRIATCDELLRSNRLSTQLSLHFRLSVGRKDRDVDNLADAIMPTFNRLFPQIESLTLTKGNPCVGTVEQLCVSIA